MTPQDALREYIKESERRVIIDGVFCARMSHEIAKKFDLEFPKSFNEFEEFLSTYKYGSNTTRFSFN